MKRLFIVNKMTNTLNIKKNYSFIRKMQSKLYWDTNFYTNAIGQVPKVWKHTLLP